MYRYYDNNFIGYLSSYEFELFSGTDSLEKFKESLKTEPKTWIYRNKEISYKRNSIGHRSKEVTQLGKYFILFLGCSHTEGTGLALEDTYPHKTANMLGMDYYNMALGGTGCDVAYNNLYHWFENDFPKPSLVSIQWPDPFRFSRLTDDDNLTVLQNLSKKPYMRLKGHISPKGPWDLTEDSEEYSKRIDVYMDEFLTEIRPRALNLLEKSNIKYIESFSFPSDEMTKIFRKQINNFTDDFLIMHGGGVDADKARDLGHPGIVTNHRHAQKIATRAQKIL